MAKFKQPSIEQLKRALEVAEQIKALETELTELLQSGDGSSKKSARVLDGVKTRAAAPKAKKKRVLSEEAREKIAAGQRARWAKANKEKKA